MTQRRILIGMALVWLLPWRVEAQEQALLYGRLLTDATVSPRYSHYNTTSASEANQHRTYPFTSYKLSKLRVHCTTNVLADQQTITIRADGSPTALSCAVTAGTADCSDDDTTSALSAATFISIESVGTTLAGSQTCYWTAQVTDAGGGALPSLIEWGSPDPVTFVAGRVCGPATRAFTHPLMCTLTDPVLVAVAIPTSGTIGGFAASAEALGVASSVTLKLCKLRGNNSCDSDANGDTGLSAILNPTTTHVEVVGGCTNASCSASAGDRYYVRLSAVSGTTGTRFLHLSFTVSGQGQTLFWAREQTTTGTNYSTWTDNGATLAGQLYRLPVATTAQNMVCWADTLITGPTATYFCSGATVTPSCPADATRFGCTWASSTTCTSAGPLATAANDYVTVKAGAAGGAADQYYGCSLELAGPLPATATPTVTPTPTLTPTITPTNTPGTCYLDSECPPGWHCIAPTPTP